MSIVSSTRGMTGLIGAVLAGILSAVMFAFALMHAETFLFLLTYLAVIPLYISGLSSGSVASLVACLTGALALGIGPSNIIVIYVFIYAVPVIVLTSLALRYRVGESGKLYWYPEGHLLTVLVLYPCIIFIGFSAVMASYPGGLLAYTTEQFHALADEINTHLDTSGENAADKTVILHSIFDQTARVMPALVGATWTLVNILGVTIAQNILIQQQWNVREGKFRLTDLHVPNLLVYAVAAMGLCGVFAPAPFNYIGTNLAIILGFPFFFAGLAVVHAWAATTRVPGTMLTVFYILLIVPIFTGFALLVPLLGVVDQWVDFRSRIAKQKQA